MQERIIIIMLAVLTMVSCSKKQTHSPPDVQAFQSSNMLSNLTTEHLAGLEWLNEPSSFTIENKALTVVAEKGTDFFNNPEDGTVTSTAPLLYQQIKGDFVATALVHPDFSSMWNAVAIMVHMDSMNWIKFAFESSAFPI